MATDKLTFAPISITLYDEDDEPIKTNEKSVLRWGMLKQALKVANSIQRDEKGDLDPDSLDAVTDFVCYLFGNRITKDELYEQADIREVMAAFRAVVGRAQILGNA